jgi:tetratricopeptide (TPR) repeat protein
MKSFIVALFALLSVLSFGDSSLLMEKDGADLDFSKDLKIRKQLELDDAFLIQLFSRWKALGAVEPQTNDWMQSIFTKDFSKALVELPKVTDGKVESLKKPAELYLLFRLGYFQTFLNEWISFTGNSGFLKSELGLALDQVVAPQSSLLLLKSGFSLNPTLRDLLKNTEKDLESRLNISLQAYKALQSGEGAVQWIGRLNNSDELRLHLAHTALLAYGKKGQLGASGKLIKKVVEPWIEKSENPDEIALYFMTLGRLLYQARAFKEAGDYYKRIPESSKYFLQARTEYLWVLLQERDFSQAMGELGTMELGIFEKRFYPEIYLVSAIGHTMMCQFTDAKDSIHQFVSVNKDWAKRISLAIKSDNPPTVEETFYSRRMRNQVLSLKKEISGLKEKKIEKYNPQLQFNLSFVKNRLKEESHRQWINRQKILESSLYKMKFVRIELLSRMRAVAEGLKGRIPGQDVVKNYQAAAVKTSKNQLVFPNDGMLWGDELFSMTGDVKNLCIKGKFYE